MGNLSYMDSNFKEISERLEAAKKRANKKEVCMVAAVKYTDAEHINYLHEVLGVNDIGENRVQQLLEHYESVKRENLRFHFIGTLQTNKVKYIIDKVCMIHSVDSLSLAKEIDRQAKKHGLTMKILVEINSGAEENKSGISFADAADFCTELKQFSNLELCGFMTMAPKCEKKEDYRKYFRETYVQGLDIWSKKLHNIGSPVFSMGMSESFEIAIEEGADFVRVGRALFTEPSSV